MSSDFKDVLRERIEVLVRNRITGVDAAVEAARNEIDQVVSRLQESATASVQTAEENATIEQISAEIAAQIGQAAAESSRLSGDLALLRDSVVDIDSQQTQADVLNSLVERAYSFAPRAILFVVKGDDAIAWAARGFDDELGNEAVRGLSVSLKADTMIGSVLNGQTTFLGEPGDQKDNALLLDRLGSTKPERIAGIPLRVRSKIVGILYADTYDTSVGSVGIEALELLVHNAGIIVELASLRQRHAEPVSRQGVPSASTATSPLVATVPAPPAAVEPEPEPTPPVEEPEPPAEVTEPEAAPAFEPAKASFGFAETIEAIPVPVAAEETTLEEFPEVSAEPPAESSVAEAEPVSFETQETIAVRDEPAAEPEGWAEPEIAPAPAHEEHDTETTLEPESWPKADETAAYQAFPDITPFAVESSPSPFEISAAPSPFSISAEPSVAPEEPPSFDTPLPFAAPQPPPPASPFAVPEDQAPTVQWAPEPPKAPPSPTQAAPAPGPGDLPPDEEKLHNDARRFARLLVSEIKLYNEQQVAEGRQNYDLYERLKDDIDRSRQMYDKRVAATVASRFDYFYDELVGTLAEGESTKLGPECPGPTV